MDKIHKEELRYLYCTQIVISMIKDDDLGGYVTRMRIMKSACKIRRCIQTFPER